jgi:cell division protein FtsN
VRLGPYGSVEELNRARDTLKSNGIDTTLIKVRDADK